ncbi:class I SAM-dependent methyltransferase [Tuwongella immobilis]|uniref:Methyltransferase domain-containing protein n=1 Tax=Tuwongella immobilis TaxID=692036 RepID=A0A6C2YPT5_9BACT|nr:class I SAM-dependent methyltransferase [Tuwongella immobilis]VIP03640.1 SAM-dependent methyltransferase, putative OS=Geobacter metallireducens (strain GS-15 / ATCC 53774 / DSM 7210) GN=Gmet_2955 PE=4 SV=1: TehB [Tuwongella immobilis]VTS04648.1 SAM-dependent methyltransferase, putative OS=Geobacter metallireducens (strain GS-15 / ATCC 53774 / DSM 7210) GN=Gmet_2955 PE=4 SV=1: TehB [Tuwongella immobilis]
MQREQWDQRYSNPGLIYGEEPNRFLVEAAHHLPHGPILSLGEGEGRNALYLAGLGFDLLAVDQSSVGLVKAVQRAESSGLTLQTQVVDLKYFPIEPRSWAGILSIFCHLPAELRRDVHARVVAGLRPGGVFILEAYTPQQLGRGTGGPSDRSMLVSAFDLESELVGLEFLHCAELEREVIEGTHHTGMAHVVQLIARKPL